MEASALTATKPFGLLRETIPINTINPRDTSYGKTQDGKRNIGADYYQFQKSIQWQFALETGFQLFVACSSGQNAKYYCKKINGQQLFYSDLPFEEAWCPFFITTPGNEGRWQFSKTTFCHNHLRNVGFIRTLFAEGSMPRPSKPLRNTTQETARAWALIEPKILPAENRSTITMTCEGICSFLKSEDITLSSSAIPRAKISIEISRLTNREISFQKLESYLSAMAEK